MICSRFALWINDGAPNPLPDSPYAAFVPVATTSDKRRVSITHNRSRQLYVIMGGTRDARPVGVQRLASYAPLLHFRRLTQPKAAPGAVLLSSDATWRHDHSRSEGDLVLPCPESTVILSDFNSEQRWQCGLALWKNINANLENHPLAGSWSQRAHLYWRNTSEPCS